MALGASGVALLGLAVAWTTAWRRAAALFALLVGAQAAALQLVDSPRYAAYQHYLPWGELIRPRAAIALAVLLLQAAVCLGIAGHGWSERRGHAARPLLPSRPSVAVLGVMAVSLAVPTASPARFAGEALLAGGIAALALLNLILIATAAPARPLASLASAIDRRVSLAGGASDRRPWDRRLPWIAAAFATLASAGLAWQIFERMPHIDDGVAYLFQARYLAAGELYLNAPPDSAAFDAAHIVVDGNRWYSKYFPGWPAVLALGVLAGTPWLVNPILGGIAVLLAHALARRLYDLRTANAAAVLLAASPWLLFMSASFMAHPLSLVLVLGALLAVERARERRGPFRSAIAGACLGGLFLTRPLDALLVAPVVVGWAALPAKRRLQPRALAALVLAAAVVGTLLFAYDHALTGRYTLAPHTLYANQTYGPGTDVMGFGPEIGVRAWSNIDPIPGHGPVDVVLNANKNLFMLHWDLFGWLTGSLLLVPLALLLPRRRTGDVLMVAIVAAVALGHGVYWFSGGPDLGARYWYPIIVPLVALTVRGAQQLHAHLAMAGGAGRGVAHRIGVGLVAAGTAAFLTFVPWRATTKHFRYRDIGPDVRRLAEERAFGEDVVFVRALERADFQEAFVLNPRTLEGNGTVYALDRGGASRAAVVAAFPGRRVWVIGRPGPRESRYSVIEGPLPPGTIP